MKRYFLSVLCSAICMYACAHTPEPAPSTPAKNPPRADVFSEALAIYKEGRMAEALERLRKASDVPAARGLLALTENRPEAVLGDTAQQDPISLRHKAQAAWRAGDGEALARATERLLFRQPDDPESKELFAMAALARSARGGRLRRVISDRPTAAAIEPRFGVPIIEGTIGEEKTRFILDTGAEISVIDEGAAERLGIRRPEGAEVTVSSNTGEITSHFGLASRIEVLGLAMEEVPFVLADLSALPPKLGVSGILGAQDLFGSDVLTIDYIQGQVSRGAESAAEQGWPLTFVFGRTIVAVEGDLEGGPRGLFRIDTGGRRSVITNEYVDKALARGAAWQVSEPEAVEVRAIGKSRRQRRILAKGRFRPVEGGPSIELTDVPVDTTSADSLITYAGKLGADAFAGKVLVLDYPACRMRLKMPKALGARS